MSTVLLADDLSPETVQTAIEQRVNVVVTRGGSQFCHGANALRYLASRGRTIDWYLSSTIKVYDLPMILQGYSVTRELGYLSIFNDKSGARCTQLSLSEPHGVGSTAGVGTISGKPFLIAMNGRSYDRFTASLMLAGLSDGASRLAGTDVVAFHGPSGQIILPCRLNDELFVRLLMDPEQGREELLYEAMVLERLRTSWVRARHTEESNIWQAAGYLRRFFDVILPLHSTYSRVIRGLLEKADTGPKDNYEIGRSLTPEILRWQVDSVGLLCGPKTIYNFNGEIPVPPISVCEDVQLTLRRLRSSLPDTPRPLAQHIALVMVVKEWRFMMSHILHRHFARCLHTLFVPSEMDERAFVGHLSSIKGVTLDTMRRA